MLNLIQLLNFNYFNGYIKKNINIKMRISNLLIKKYKLIKFIKYLKRVKKPIFFIRFKKRIFIYNDKWKNLNNLYNNDNYINLINFQQFYKNNKSYKYNKINKKNQFYKTKDKKNEWFNNKIKMSTSDIKMFDVFTSFIKNG